MGILDEPTSITWSDADATYALKPDNGARAVGKSELVYDVRDFGAVGDGVTDDTAAINSAITAANASAGGLGLVVLPYTANGYATVTAPTLRSGVTLRGEKHVTIKPTASRAYLLQTASGSDLIDVEGLALDTDSRITSALLRVGSGNTNVRVADCKFVDTLTALYGIDTTASSSDLIFERNDFLGCKHGVRLNQGPSRVRIQANRFRNWTQRAIYVASDATYAVDSLWITDNHISELGTGGTVRQPIAIDGASTNLNKRVHIRGNTVIGPRRAYTAADPGTADQISIQCAQDFVVSHNISVDGGDMGITIGTDTYRGAVTGNVCVGNDVSGIDLGVASLNATNNISVTGNTCMNNGQNRNGDRAATGRAGIRIVNAVDLLIVGNRCGDDQIAKTQQHGITFGNLAGAVIGPNGLSGNALSGLYSDTGNTRIDYGDPQKRATKSANQILNGSTRYQNDSHLHVALDPHAVYEWEGFIIYSSSATADIKFAVRVPSGTRVDWGMIGAAREARAGTTTSTATFGLMDVGGTVTLAGTNVGSKMIGRITGTIAVASHAGDLVLRWAQATRHATNTIVHAGSSITVKRVG